MNPDGTGIARLASQTFYDRANERDATSAWSPVDDRVAYISSQNRNDEIWVGRIQDWPAEQFDEQKLATDYTDYTDFHSCTATVEIHGRVYL